MNAADSSKPIINPRQVLKADGASALARMLAATGYMVQREVLSDLEQAILSCMPQLVEGPRGGGKTALAEALAEACNLPVFYLQGMEGLTLDDVLYSWDRVAQEAFVRQAVTSGAVTLDEARARQWGAEFLVLGEALAAYDLASREDVVPILIVDEADKLNPSIEDMLLQLFGRGYASVPRFGDVGIKNGSAERWPIVVMLSNDIRHDLSAPTRSRCIYTWVGLPSAEEGVSILATRVPEAGPQEVAWVAKALDCVQVIPGVVDKPALREGISLLKAIVRDGVNVVDEDMLYKYLCHLAKRHNDRDYLRLSLGRVVHAMNSPDSEIDGWVSRVFAGRSRTELKAVA